MLTEYKIVYAGGEGEIVEKKSRFIATVVPVETDTGMPHTIVLPMRLESVRRS